MSDSESSTEHIIAPKKPTLLNTLRDKRVALEKEKAEKKSSKKVVKKEVQSLNIIKKPEPEPEPEPVVVKPKKKTIVYMEESSEEEEEVVIKRHKPKQQVVVTPAPAPAPAPKRKPKPSVPKVIEKPQEVLTGYNLLDNLLFSRR